MGKLQKYKKQIAGTLAAALAVPLILWAMSLDPDLPTLSFEGAQINVLAEDDIQLLVDVCVRNVELAEGAAFNLNYNPEYIVPSNHSDNTILAESGSTDVGDGFRVSPDLYQGSVDSSLGLTYFPFRAATNTVNTNTSQISMSLFIDGRIEPAKDSGLTRLEWGEDGEFVYNVFNAKDRRVLGTLSFKVTDPAKLPDIVKKFTMDLRNDPQAVDGSGEHLLWFSAKNEQNNPAAWQMTACVYRPAPFDTYAHIDQMNDYGWAGAYANRRAQSAFAFQFPKTIIAVEAAEAELTINAYQAYTKGTLSDLDVALQKYSPTVIVHYADGSQGTFMMPWSRYGVAGDPATEDNVPWTKSVVNKKGAGESMSVVTDGNYDPTGGEYYIYKQFCYKTEEVDGNGDPVVKAFPTPVKVHMTVKPVTLVDVTADDLTRSYPLNNNLVEGETRVQSVSALELPREARLITDVLVGGVSLTMDIPGWSHEQENGNWPSGSTGTMMVNLWKDDTADANKEYLHWPTADDANKWAVTDTEANGQALGKNRAGDYTFVMAETYGGTPKKRFTKTEIKAAYPWMTVPEDRYPLEKDLTALRRIVWNDDNTPGSKKLVDANNYQVKYVSTVDGTNHQPELTLEVTKKADNGVTTSLAEDSIFRIKMPDGREIGIDAYTEAVHGVDLDKWLDPPNNDGSYSANSVTVGGYGERGFDLVTNPGDPTKGTNPSERELLRRHINLGGWYSVAVNEDPNSNYWSDFIPVYVPPRDNLYTESKEYNFIASNAELFPWPGGIGTTVILPPGQYATVDATGAEQYDTVTGTDNTSVQVRHVERYGVSTTYDGATGAQPGELHTFTIEDVEPKGWVTAKKTIAIPKTTDITQYGPNEFLHNALYTAFGRVKNHAANTADGNETATIRVQGELADPEEEEKITLTCSDPRVPTGQVISGGDGNVDRSIFTAKLEGYTTRQDYVLTITNVGTVDIYGLDIDSLTDYEELRYTKDGGGGHFVILTPPASFLPAGESTTFTLSYVYDLKADGNNPLDYIDKLYITSNSKHTTGTTAVEGTDYLLNFDAEFQVTKEDIHRVNVVVDPADLSMGTAYVVVGDQGGGTMNVNPTSNAFASKSMVYILVSPEEGFERESVTAVDDSGATITIHRYGDVTGETLTVPDGKEVWYFEMPDYDTTVTVKFYEPIETKLRLSYLRVFAAQTDQELALTNPAHDNYEYPVWQKSYTSGEINNALTGNKQELDKMTKGTAAVKGFDPMENQYLVVIPKEADYSQVEATLRKITGDAALSGITVQMFLYENVTDVYTEGAAKRICQDMTGNTTDPTKHYGPSAGGTLPGNAFASPEKGKSKFVNIKMSYTEGGVTHEQNYYVEIHRAPDTYSAKRHYGNSPYGMIMNATNIDAADKSVAKEKFVENRYSFDGLDAKYVPSAVKNTKNSADGDIAKIHYWSEAWVPVDAAYEPESYTGTDVYDAAWMAENNLDLSDYAFFAIIGEEFEDPGLIEVIDSSGRPADISKAVISLEAYTLDTTAATQAARFDLPTDPTALAARTITLSRSNVAGGTISADWADLSVTGDKYLRPGQYKLTYTLQDFDYDENDANPHTLKVTRDFVVLAPVGDVNADHTTANATDEALTKNRVYDPLGYMAQHYEGAGIFRLRTCDVNNDRNINNIDANTIRLHRGSGSGMFVKRFYLPVNYK